MSTPEERSGRCTEGMLWEDVVSCNNKLAQNLRKAREREKEKGAAMVVGSLYYYADAKLMTF